MKWRVDITSQVELGMIQDLKSGKLSKDDFKAIRVWVDDIEESGLEVAQKNANWRDHALEGVWFGFRAVSFSISGRIIYRVESAKVVVRVVRVTADHDYSKRGDR